MRDHDKNKKQLIDEIGELRSQVDELEMAEAKRAGVERELRKRQRQLEQRTNQLLALQKVTASIQRSLDLGEVLQLVAQAVVENLEYDHSFILSIDQGKNVLKGMAFFSKGGFNLISDVERAIQRPLATIEIPLVRGYSRGMDYALSGQVMVARYLYEIGEPPLSREECDAVQKLLRAKTIISVPLFVADQHIGGMIAFSDREDPTEIDLEPLKHLAGQAMVAAENARLYDEIFTTYQQLRESQEISRGMLESAAAGIFLIQDGKWVYVSPLFTQISGYTSDELIGTYTPDYIHPDDREKTMKDAIANLKGERDSPYEFRFLRKGGEPVWLLEKVASIGYKGKRAAIGSAMDITELKRTEDALRESEEKLRIMFESIGDGITVTNLKGEVLQENDAALRMGGYKKKDVIGKDGYQFVAEKDRPRAMAELSKAFKEGRSATLDLLFTTKDGKEYDAEVTSTLLRDGSGAPVGMVSIAKDVSERKRMEAELRDSEEKLRFMFESIGDGVIVTDLEGKIIEANKAALQMAGYDQKQDIMGRSGFDFIAERDRARAIEENLKNIAEGHGSTVEYTAVDRAGNEFDAEAIGAMLRDRLGNPAGFIVALRDITARKEIEQMKTDFVSLVSHQLKAPVAGIKAYIENMLGGLAGDLTEKQAQYLAEMRELCSRNYRLISDLLNISMIERGVLTVDLQLVKLGEVVELALRDYTGSIEEKGLALNLEGTGADVVVIADKDKLVESLRNVIDNALKFTDKGSITIKAGSKGRYGTVEVQDTGRGMSTDVLGTLFQKEKVLSGAPKAGGGATIGLYIAKGFMELQNGDITVTSAVGKGSTFTLQVPIK